MCQALFPAERRFTELGTAALLFDESNKRFPLVGWLKSHQLRTVSAWSAQLTGSMQSDFHQFFLSDWRTTRCDWHTKLAKNARPWLAVVDNKSCKVVGRRVFLQNNKRETTSERRPVFWLHLALFYLQNIRFPCRTVSSSRGCQPRAPWTLATNWTAPKNRSFGLLFDWCETQHCLRTNETPWTKSLKKRLKKSIRPFVTKISCTVRRHTAAQITHSPLINSSFTIGSNFIFRPDSFLHQLHSRLHTSTCPPFSLACAINSLKTPFRSHSMIIHLALLVPAHTNNLIITMILLTKLIENVCSPNYFSNFTLHNPLP